jgi:hypothetical protein
VHGARVAGKLNEKSAITTRLHVICSATLQATAKRSNPNLLHVRQAVLPLLRDRKHGIAFALIEWIMSEQDFRFRIVRGIFIE